MKDQETWMQGYWNGRGVVEAELTELGAKVGHCTK